MGKMITAIGEGVAQFAGPLGAPIKALISYQNAEHMEHVFDELLKRSADKTDNMEQVLADLSAVHDEQREGDRQIVLLLKCIAGLLSEHTEQLQQIRNAEQDGSTLHEQAAIVSELLRDNESIVSKHYVLTEQALLDELLRLVGDQENLLNAIGLVTPFVRGWFAPGMSPHTAFFHFVEGLSGRTDKDRQKIYRANGSVMMSVEGFRIRRRRMDGQRVLIHRT